MDPATEALYTNPEVIAVDQHSQNNRQLARTDSLIVWTAEPETGGGHYVAIFNLGDAPKEATYAWKDLGLTETKHGVRDLWTRKDLGKASSLHARLPAHAAMLYRVR